MGLEGKPISHHHTERDLQATLQKLLDNDVRLLDDLLDIKTALSGLRKLEKFVMGQVQDLQTVVSRIDAATTKAGEAQKKEADDVRRIVSLLKQPGVDITAQIAALSANADRTEALGQALIDADAEVLKSDTPIPDPAPARRR